MVFCISQIQAQVLVSYKQQGLMENEKEDSMVMSEAYQKLWNPEVQTRIDEGIERNRKGETTIEVVDANGRPVKGASLIIQQNTHAFLFGCNAFVLGQLGSPERNRQYEQIFTRICNFATVPIYWGGTEPQRGRLRYLEGEEDIWRRPPVNRFIPFAKKYGLTLKAHPMLWHTHNPDWLPEDPYTLKDLYRKRFCELSDRYAKDIAIWEVTNESTGCLKTYPLYSDDKSYVAWALINAGTLFGDDNLLMINDYTRFNEELPQDNAYYKQLQGLFDQGLRIQGIGLQFHLWFEPQLMEKHLEGERYRPETMLAVYESFAALDRPLYITEITVPTPQGEDGEIIQAKVLRNLYRLWFSVPAMAGVTYWNLGDSMAYDNENTAAAGLVDKELKPKLSYRVLDGLINREWKTCLSIKTGDGGKAVFRGFYGQYAVEVSLEDGRKQSFEFDLSSSDTTVQRLMVKR